MSANRQLDLFVALIGDVPFRDEREAMSAPLVSLSKNRRTRIEWEGPSGQKVLVTAPEDTGIATIWDYDVLLWGPDAGGGRIVSLIRQYHLFTMC